MVGDRKVIRTYCAKIGTELRARRHSSRFPMTGQPAGPGGRRHIFPFHVLRKYKGAKASHNNKQVSSMATTRRKGVAWA